MNVLQVQPTAPNPVLELGGYTPTTDYWVMVIAMVNTTLRVTAENGYEPAKMRLAVDALIDEELFKGTHTAIEWAEFVMAVNHMLWLLYSQQGHDKYLDELLSILNDLYYKWHNKALDTLKGDDLSTYLRITD